MEKVRRKRINNSLEQLRTLLPHSINMKKDMASLLEQTVEYINIMHTVLNQDKPACLNKVYLSYRQKTEEIESFRKSFRKTVAKKSKMEPGCSWSQPYYHGVGNSGTAPSNIDSLGKHSFMGNPYYDQSAHNAWQVQKNQDQYVESQRALCSGPQNHYMASQQNPCVSRSFRYSSFDVPSGQKYYDVTSMSTNTHEDSAALNQFQPNDSWQYVGQHNSNIHQFSGDDIQSSDNTNSQKLIPVQSTENDWYKEFCESKIDSDEPHSTKQDDGNSTDALCARDENSPDKSGTDLDEISISPETVPQISSALKSENNVIGTVDCCDDITAAAMATGILKCDSMNTQSNHATSSEAFYGNNSCSNPYGYIAPWMPMCSLPPLTLGQSNIVTAASHQVAAAADSAISNIASIENLTQNQ